MGFSCSPRSPPLQKSSALLDIPPALSPGDEEAKRREEEARARAAEERAKEEAERARREAERVEAARKQAAEEEEARRKAEAERAAAQRALDEAEAAKMRAIAEARDAAEKEVRPSRRSSAPSPRCVFQACSKQRMHARLLSGGELPSVRTTFVAWGARGDGTKFRH